jgi:hypothetical protein
MEGVAVALPVIPHRTWLNGQGIPLVESAVGGLPRNFRQGRDGVNAGGAANENLPRFKGLFQCC